MGNGLIECDLTLETYFTYGPSADVITRPGLPRRDGQPILMRGEVGIKADGQLRPLVAHNTTHIDMSLHFIEGAVLSFYEGANSRERLEQLLQMTTPEHLLG